MWGVTMTNETKEESVFVITISESDVEGMLQVAVDYPEDMDDSNLRPFEYLGLYLMDKLHEVSEDFQSISQH